MTEAGGITIGGIMVIFGWAGLRLILILADAIADEFRIATGVQTKLGAAQDERDYLCPHATAVEPETILLASGNLVSFTGERADA